MCCSLSIRNVEKLHQHHSWHLKNICFITDLVGIFVCMFKAGIFKMPDIALLDVDFCIT